MPDSRAAIQPTSPAKEDEMRLSLLFLLLLAASMETTRVDTTAQKAYQATAAESDPCSADTFGTVLCGRLRVPGG
jgi:hypothetical protein